MSDDNRKVAFICSKGNLDMAYPALIMGWAALGNGIDVTIFFTEVPPVREYMQMLADAGAKLYACKMSVDMMELKKEDFVDGVLDIVTAGDFMDMTEGAQIIFI